MLFSVIIPFLNAARHLPDCLEGLAAQSFTDAEYILVDNNSADGSRAIADAFSARHPELRIRVLTEQTRGAAAARNAGASEAQGVWLAFTDADCVASAGWLAQIAEVVREEPARAGVAGSVVPAPSAAVIARFLSLYTLPATSEDRVYQAYTLVRGGFPTCNLAVRRDVFEQVGGFDASIGLYGEDHDLCARIYAAGYSIRSTSRAAVAHAHRSDLGGMLRQCRGFGRSHAVCLRKSVAGAFILQAPFVEVAKLRRGLRIWLDANPADKKLLGALIPGFFWWPLWGLAPAYFAYLCVSVVRRARKLAAPVRGAEAPLFAALLLLKSAAMTWGRLAGSVRYRVLCL
ncbi:MAG: glycosyltransferase [Kiritimatiellae bacterium]|nr:glycosyltransferase [Kiritimatiellia bacterium]